MHTYNVSIRLKAKKIHTYAPKTWAKKTLPIPSKSPEQPPLFQAPFPLPWGQRPPTWVLFICFSMCLINIVHIPKPYCSEFCFELHKMMLCWVHCPATSVIWILELIHDAVNSYSPFTFVTVSCSIIQQCWQLFNHCPCPHIYIWINSSFVLFLPLQIILFLNSCQPAPGKHGKSISRELILLDLSVSSWASQIAPHWFPTGFISSR